MNKQSGISYVQLGFMAIGSAMMFPYTYLPILRQQPANQDVWISLLLSFVYVLIFSIPALFLTNKFRGLNINQINEVIMGKYFGKVTASIFMVFAFFCYLACLIITVLYVNLFILPETPAWAVVLSLIIPITYASLKGAGTMGRLVIFVVPYILITILLFFIMSFEDMDYHQILPILSDSKLKDIFIGAFFTAARYSEIIIILVFTYYLKKSDSPNKAFILGLAIFGIAYLLILMPVLLVLGPEFAQISNNPYYTFTRQVGGTDFIQRLQSINLLAWFMGVTIKLMLYNYIASNILKNIFKKGNRKYYVIGTSFFTFILLLVPIINKNSFVHYLNTDSVFPWIVLSTAFIIPLILCIVYLLRRKTINPQINQIKDANEQQELQHNMIDEDEIDDCQCN